MITTMFSLVLYKVCFHSLYIPNWSRKIAQHMRACVLIYFYCNVTDVSQWYLLPKLEWGDLGMEVWEWGMGVLEWSMSYIGQA